MVLDKPAVSTVQAICLTKRLVTVNVVTAKLLPVTSVLLLSSSTAFYP